MQGLVGIGESLKRPDFIAGAAKAADQLIGLMASDGFLPGCFDQEYHGTVSWCCLTGTAQTSIVWGKLARITGEERYREACRRANRYLMAHHDITHPDPSVRGGVTGSWPVWGDYGRFHIFNWATNFFVEALLIEDSLANSEFA
jgi:hypothetical protein